MATTVDNLPAGIRTLGNFLLIAWKGKLAVKTMASSDLAGLEISLLINKSHKSDDLEKISGFIVMEAAK